MQIRDEARYRNTDVDTVLDTLSSAEFQDRLCASLRAAEYTVDVTPAERGACEVVIQRSLPTDLVPDFLRSFVGATVTVVERTAWGVADADGRRPGTMRVSIAGTPVSMAATTQLAADGADVVQTVSGDLKASVPLMGGRIEKAVEPAIRAALRLQESTAQEWLDEHR